MLPREGIWKSMYSVGIAAALNIALASFLLSALNWILAPFSQVYILVLGVYYKLQALLYQAACGLVQGMRPLVGYNYGAGEYGRVKSIFRAAVIVIVGIMAAGTILCQAAPDWLMGLFKMCIRDRPHPRPRAGPVGGAQGLRGEMRGRIKPALRRGNRGACLLYTSMPILLALLETLKVFLS